MTNKILQMTVKELNIHTIMERLVKKELGIKVASKLINKSERQTKRLKKKYINFGVEGLIHKARGKKSNHKIDESKYNEAIQIIKDKYSDYGPTLSAEKLEEKHNISLSVSTLRVQMIKNGIWKVKTRKKDKKQFTARERKENYGEMIQYDGSYHPWFEGRDGTGYQCLLVGIDDATGEIMAKFAKNEGLIETFKFWKEYIEINGKPQSIYLDKFATYKVNYPDATDDKELATQFGRVCNDLGIQLIFANTPQAKGRVERMNGTLQDRLVKELRENNISDIENANKFLKEVFLPKFNKKFILQARGEYDLHTKLRNDEISKLDQIFSEHKERKVANDYTIKFNNKYYQLYKAENKEYRLNPGQKVSIERHLNGDIKISYNGTYITSKESFERPEKQNSIGIPRKGNINLLNINNDNSSKTIKDKKEKESQAKILVGDSEDHYYIL